MKKTHGGARPNSGPKPSTDRCPCGCGMTRARGLKRHPTRVSGEIQIEEKEVAKLVKNLKKTAVLPRGFGLWSMKLQVMWLKQNQA